MPAAVKEKAVVVSLEVNSPEWKVIEGIRNQFVTLVNTKEGEPKLTKEGVQQVRKANGDDILSRIASAVLLNATEETLAQLADEAKDKAKAGGKEEKYKVGDFIRAIPSARPVAGAAAITKDLKDMTDEELEAYEKRVAEEKRKRAELKKAGKGTKDVAAV